MQDTAHSKYDFELDLSLPLRRAFVGQIEERATVLEFGPATGFLTRYLAEEKHCRMYIVEYNRPGFELAKQWAEGGLCGDLEELPWDEEFADVGFDCVLFGDVLEHLRDPAAVLRRVKKLLKPGGKLVVSLPNISYAGVTLGLLQGGFEYTKHGILDDTHLQFFTRKSLMGMVEGCGFSIEALEGFEQEPVESEFAHWLGRLPAGLEQYALDRPWARVYQYLLVARPARAGEQSKPELAPEAPTTFATRLYYDDGTGFSEENSIEAHLTPGEGEVRFALPEGVRAAKLRWEPAPSRGLLCDKALLVAGGKDYAPVLSNEDLILNGTRVFTYNPAQFVFEADAGWFFAGEVALRYALRVEYGYAASEYLPALQADYLEKLREARTQTEVMVEMRAQRAVDLNLIQDYKNELEAASDEMRKICGDAEQDRLRAERAEGEAKGLRAELARAQGEGETLCTALEGEKVARQAAEQRGAHLAAELERTEAQRDAVAKTLEEVTGSVFWRASGPLRRLAGRLRGGGEKESEEPRNPDHP